MKRRRIPYSDAEMEWLEANYRMILGDYHRAFVAEFNRDDVTVLHLNGLRKRMGWKVDRREPGRYAGRGTRYTAAELAFLEQHQAMNRRALHAAFIAEFGRAISFSALNGTCKRKGLSTGRDGRFVKGQVPPNKGKRCPEGRGGRHPNARRTQFKAGYRGGKAEKNYKPIGTERLSKEGYLERKINDDLPFKRRWRMVHLIRWEAINGPVPAGMVLKSLDGDRSNTDPSNWTPVPRALLPRLNGTSGRDYDHAPAEVKPAIMAIAKLQQRAAELERSK